MKLHDYTVTKDKYCNISFKNIFRETNCFLHVLPMSLQMNRIYQVQVCTFLRLVILRCDRCDACVLFEDAKGSAHSPFAISLALPLPLEPTPLRRHSEAA